MPSPASRAAEIAATTSRLVATFERELRAALRAADREMQQLVREQLGVAGSLHASRVLVLKRQVRDILTRAGYDVTVSAGVDAGAQAYLQGYLGAHETEAAVELLGRNLPRLEAMRVVATTDLFAQGDEIATRLWRSVVQSAFTERSAAAILADLDSALDIGRARVETLFDTSMSIYARAVEAVGTEDLPPEQLFRYVGPDDEKTREFCAEHLDEELTRAEIEALDNEQLPDPFLTGGGYNCRHLWLAVERPSA